MISSLTEMPEQILRGNFRKQEKLVLNQYSFYDYICAFA